MLFLTLGTALAPAAQDVSLAWDPNPEPDIAGYKLYYGTASRTYLAPVDVGNTTNGVIPSLTEGVTYYFAATAYNTSGLESDFSDEISWTVPVPNAPPDITLAPEYLAQIQTDAPITGVQISDPDIGSANITVNLSVSYGILTLRNDVNNGLRDRHMTGNGTSSVILVAPLNTINNTLSRANGMIYTGNLNFVGADTLVVTVTDDGNGGGNAIADTDSATILVQGGVQDTWRNAHFDAADLADPAKETTVWGDLADPDQDGQNNLLEYALGLNPLAADTTADSLQTEIVQSGGQYFAALTFVRRKNDPNLLYIPEASSDKVVWNSGAGSLQQTGVTDLDASFEVASYQDLTPISPAFSRFIRLRVVTVNP